ncbi:MAG: transcriptional repressor NrdR [Nitriliruptorales bacterium]|nr:transcriptional repressor NrdR [Nitriliruptorales bacterium]
MRCPYCKTDDDRVVDSRSAEQGAAIRRRRECRSCGRRFSTYERIEAVGILVRKRSGIAEPYDRAKVRAGIEKATKNLPVSGETVADAVAAVDDHIRTAGLREVPSETVGAEVLSELRVIDPVAYMRFASVYKGFTSPDDFARELAHLEKDAPPKPPSG